MRNKFYFTLLSILFFSHLGITQSLRESISLSSEERNTITATGFEQFTNFDEFSYIFPDFIKQNSKNIFRGNYKKARESILPFLEKFRTRLGFKTSTSLDQILKNIDLETIQLAQKEMSSLSSSQTSFNNLSSPLKEKISSAIHLSVPSKYFQSILLYKKTLLLYLTATVGEQMNADLNLKEEVLRRAFPDILFLLAPAIRFHTADPKKYFVVFDYELNQSPDQDDFELKLVEFIETYHSFFYFVRSKESARSDFEKFRKFQREIIRGSLSFQISSSDSGSTSYSYASQSFRPMGPSDRQRASNSRHSNPANSDQWALNQNPPKFQGTLKYDLESLQEISNTNNSTGFSEVQLKEFLLSSAMTWWQKEVQFTSSFTHSSSQINATIKDFNFSPHFVTTLVNYYYLDLILFFSLAKSALSQSNNLASRDELYNCLVESSLSPMMKDCDAILSRTSELSSSERIKLMDSYTRLLRISRMTFELPDQLSHPTQSQIACDEIKKLQNELVRYSISPSLSPLPSLLNIQGPRFKIKSTGAQHFLCFSSLNYLLQFDKD